MIEYLVFLPGLMITLLGLSFGLRFVDRPSASRSPVIISLYFVIIFSAPFIGAYTLASVMFPNDFWHFVQLTFFGFVLSLIAGVSAGFKRYSLNKTVISNTTE